LLLIGIGFSLLTKLPPTIRNGILSAVLLMLPLAGGYALFVSLTLFLPMSSMLILGGSIIIVQFIFYHQTVRSELNAITTQLQEKEKHLQLLEHNAKREHTASEMQVLRSEIEKNQKEISHLKERLEDLQPYNPNSSSVRMVESFHGIVYYNNGPIAQTVETIKKIADHDSPVLILGESGTGKELVARALHASSTRTALRCGKLWCAE
jgi:transcriptional regulator with GAF, ATPase, and Fis domain